MTEEEKVDAFMPLWIGAYLADTLKFTTLQHGAYILLLMAYWRDRTPLKDNDDELRSIAKLERQEWKKNRPVLAAKFRVADGVWWHKRVEQELADAQKRKAAATAKARKAAEARWAKEGQDEPGDAPEHPVEHPSRNAPSNAPSMPQASPQALLEECPTSPPTTTSPSLRSGEGRAVKPVRPEDVGEEVWADWLALRAKKRAPVTTTVLREARKEADAARLTLQRFLEIWCARGSQGLQADWLKPNERGTAPPTNGKHTGFADKNYREGINDDGSFA